MTYKYALQRKIIKHRASRTALFMSPHFQRKTEEMWPRIFSCGAAALPPPLPFARTAALGAFAYYLNSGQRSELGGKPRTDTHSTPARGTSLLAPSDSASNVRPLSRTFLKILVPLHFEPRGRTRTNREMHAAEEADYDKLRLLSVG